MTTIVSIQQGGTGANNVSDAINALGVLSNTGGEFTGEVQFTGPNNSINISNNALISGNVVVSGNIIIDGYGLFGDGIEEHFTAKNIDSSTITVAGFANTNSASEIMVINKSNGALSYAEFIALNDKANQEQGWISIGVNSSEYNDPSYTLTGPDDGYILYEAPLNSNNDGDLIIGTGSNGQNNHIVLAAGGFTPTDAQMVISPADLKEADITNSILTSNVATLTTANTHTFIANDQVIISGVGAPYDGLFTIANVTSNTFTYSVTNANIGSSAESGTAKQYLPFNKGTVQLTAQLFVGENSKSTIETADITLAQGHAIPLGIVVDNDGPGQTVMFNKSNGTLAYSEFIAHNDAGNVEMGWISMGINSSGYDDPQFPITKADDGYLLYEPPANTNGDGDLIIGTGTNGTKNRLIFAAEGFDEANAQMIITPDESVRISINTNATSGNTGALQVAGGVGIEGSLFVQGNQTIQGDLIVNGSQVTQSIQSVAASGPISLVGDGNIANTWDFGIVGTYAKSISGQVHAVTNKELANNLATLTTANNHGYNIENYAVVTSVDATFNGTHRITAVTANTFSFFKLANNITSTAATGNVSVSSRATYTGVIKDTANATWKLLSNIERRPDFNANLTNAVLDNLQVATLNATTLLTSSGANVSNAVLKTGSTMTGTLNVSSGGINISSGGLIVAGGANVSGNANFTSNTNISSGTFFVDSVNRRIGLGTTNPHRILTIDGGNTTSRVLLQTSNANANFGQGFDLFMNTANAAGVWNYQTDGILQFGTNNTERARIDANGNVGIGNTSPSCKLDVVQSIVGSSGALSNGIRVITTTTNPGISIGQSDAARKLDINSFKVEVSNEDFLLSTAGNYPIRFITNSIECMRITNAGAVLIGTTTNPTGGTTQHFFSHSSNTITAVIIGDAANTSNATGLYLRSTNPNIVRPTNIPIYIGDTGETKHVTILGTNNGGNVGIGTTNPTTLLNLYAVGTAGNGYNEGAIKIGGVTSSLGAQLRYSAFSSGRVSLVNLNDTGGSGSSIDLGFGTVNTGDGRPSNNVLTITQSGFVGIGTTNPSVKFHVVGSSILGNNTSIDPDSYSNTIVAGAIADGSGWEVTSAIGGNAGTGDSWGIGHSGSALYFGMQNGSAVNTMQSYMIFDPNRNLYLVPTSGNVGIGVTVPASKLHISGSSTSRNTIVSNITLDGGTSVENPYDGFGFGVNFIGRDYGNAIRNYSSIYTIKEGQSSSSGGGDPGFKAGLSFYTNSGGASNTNPTEKMRIKSNGNVGIGTDNPVSKLSVATTSDPTDLGSTGLVIGGATTLTTGAVLMLNFTPIGASSNRSRAGIGCVVGSDWGVGNLTFYTKLASDSSALTTSDERMRITAGGNLVVGDTTASARFTAVGASTSSILTVATLRNPINDAGTGHGARLVLHSTTDTGRGVAIASSSESNYAVDNSMLFYTSASSTLSERMRITAAGNVLPGADNLQNLGATNYRWANIYTADLNLSNRDSQNDVDGTWGEWTIQEGEEHLFLINKRNGKRYAFVLKEIE